MATGLDAGYDKAEWEKFLIRRKSWTDYCDINPYIWAAIALAGHLGDRPLHHILDLGCGDGRFLNTLGAIWDEARLSGIDGSAEAINETLQNVESVHVAQRDMASPLLEKHYDLITCMFSLYHAEDMQAVIRNAYQGLKPGGLFMFSTISPFSLEDIWKDIGVQWTALLNSPFGRIEDGHGIVHYLDDAGFEKTQSVSVSAIARFPSQDALREFVSSAQTFSAFAENVDDTTRLEDRCEFVYAIGQKPHNA